MYFKLFIDEIIMNIPVHQSRLSNDLVIGSRRMCGRFLTPFMDALNQVIAHIWR